MKKQFQIIETDDGARLDRFLVEKIRDSGLSRSKIQKYITSGSVLVNGNKVTKHHFLSTGDEVTVDIPADDTTVQEKVPVDIEVLHEDDALLVINKQTGVLVHPTEHSAEWTIADFVLEQCPDAANVGDDPTRPGIVHRLDRDVSGVMVIAKTTDAYVSLKKQFKDRTIGKEYRAIVFGVPSQETGVIKFAIARSKTHGGKMAARPEDDEEARDAWTEYEVLQNVHQRYAYLAVKIKTGRTHQIRAHLAAIDHPIVGDHLYHSNHYKSLQHYPRIFLHAYRLQLIHPKTGELVQFESKMPKEFAEFLHT